MECQRKMVLLTHLRTYSLWFIIIFYEPLSFSILGHFYGTSEYTTMLKIYQWYVINVVCLSQDQEGVRLHSSVLPLILRLFFFLRWTGSGSKLNYSICLLSSAWFLGGSWAGRRFSHSNIILCVREMCTGYSLS